MAKINKLMVGESLVGEGNEVAHIDLIIGPRGSAAESAFANALTNNKDGFTSLLAVVAPNLATKPSTVMFNKVTIKGAKQAVQMFGPAQHAVAKAVADSVADGTIPAAEADDIFICVGVFIHWEAADDKKIHEYNYRAVKESIERAVERQADARGSRRPARLREAPVQPLRSIRNWPPQSRPTRGKLSLPRVFFCPLPRPAAEPREGERRQSNHQRAQSMVEVRLGGPWGEAGHESREFACGGQPVKRRQSEERQPDDNQDWDYDCVHGPALPTRFSPLLP